MNSLIASVQVLWSNSLCQSKQRKYLAAVATMMGIVLYGAYSGNAWSFVPAPLSYFLLAFIPFCLAFLLQLVFWKGLFFAGKRRFWVLVFAAPAIFTAKPYLLSITSKYFLFTPGQPDPFTESVFRYAGRALMLIVAVFAIWYYQHRKKIRLASASRAINQKLLWMIFLGILPLVAWAVQQTTFAAVYPKAVLSAGLHSNDAIWKWVLFEMSYALDFFSIEFFFRGFLLFAFVRYCGVMAIVPAACFYCCIHFDKPLAEAVSSFFGAILLGSISYYTRSIWAGFWIHLTLAWLMELASFYIYHL